MQMVNFAILFVVLKKFVFAPLGTFLEDRQKTIAESLTTAEDNKKKSAAMLEEQQKMKQEAVQEIRAMKASAEESIRKEQQNILSEARKESERILNDAQKDIQLGYNQAKQQLIDEVGSLALNLTKNILKRDMSDADHQNIVSDYLTKLKA